ncbi:MAG TPA: NAD(P)-dependent oxidoreductase [Jatrophihabitans sp.]|nr:NAD(P)-dependent oxidoreductase [Jatrophihabitans sp.]
MRVGLIGVGKMGAPIGRRLIHAGHDVSVFNRSRQPMLDLVEHGARAAESAADVAGTAEVVLTSLPTVAAVETVYDELIGAARPGQLFIDHSTTALQTTRSTAQRLADAGAAFLDAPVSGGPAGAEGGTLTIMVGGEQEVFDRAAPVFASYGKNIRLCGRTGSGQIVKLVNQLLVAVHTAASADAALLAVRLGVDLETVKDVVGTSFGGSTMLLRNLPRFAQQDYSPATPVELIAKDLRIIQSEAEQAGIVLTLADSVEPIYAEAVSLGRAKDDMSVLYRQAEQRSRDA